MYRPILMLIGALAVAAGLVAGAFELGARLCAHHMAAPTDDLQWLRLEFHLSDADMQHVRTLHEAYVPQCREYCAQIAVAKTELQQLLSESSPAPNAVKDKLLEIGRLRAECQANMLRHFREVSQAMPKEQGEHYLAEMQRLTLGAHEQVEQSMSSDAHAGHVHH